LFFSRGKPQVRAVMSEEQSVTVAESFEESLKAAGHLGAVHVAAVELGRRLAAQIDAGDLGQAQRFLAVLKALGLTVQVSETERGDRDISTNPLDELRARRAARNNRA